MKRLTLVVALLLPVVSHAANPRWDLGRGFSIGLDTSLDIEGVGARDYNNGQWLTGLSKEVFPVFKGDTKVVYIAAENLFIVDEKGKGALGGALGIPTGPITDLLQKYVPGAKLPSWAAKASAWTSLEVGAGYRFFDLPAGVRPWAYTIGGRVRIPVDEFLARWKK